MSNIDNDGSINQPKFAGEPLSIKDLTAVLIRHYDFHDGYYDLSVEFNIGVGAVGPNSNQLAPGAILGISRIGLNLSENMGPMSVDAAIVNPRKKTNKKSSG